MADDGVDSNKSMDVHGVDFDKTINDDAVDLDISMDDEVVELFRSIGDDYIKVTGDLDKSMADDAVDSNKSMNVDGVDLDKTVDDDAVDLDISMDDEVVELFRSIGDDFIKVTGDLDKSVDDKVVELLRSIGDDFIRVTGDLDKSMDDEEVELFRSIDDDFIKITGARKFSFEDLVSATNNFSKQEKLGKGGFGTVYRGFLKELDCYVAVKRVSRDSKQGTKEYASEVKIISQLRHKNIVQLMGWCHEKKELLLVYEFMPNGSLDSHLFKDNSLLPWEKRYKIARGLASGLVYLHQAWELYVVHRDIKASNIMLDSDFNAKIGDFGLARLGDHGKCLECTPIAEGTVGYVAPEYATTGRASKESDVYSFGIVALEIACGRKVIDRMAIGEDQINLREWVWDLYGEGKILEAADPKLEGEFDKKQLECLMTVGLWCAHPDPKLRPTIENAFHVLNFAVPGPNVPSQMPTYSYFAPFSMSSSDIDLVVGSKSRPSRVGYNDYVRTKQQKLWEGGFGALYRAILRELKSSRSRTRKRSEWKKKLTYFETQYVYPWMFSYEDVVDATDNFSERLKIGDRGSRTLYKGLFHGSYFTVVRMSMGSTQAMKECGSEVMIRSRLRHRNLVKFISRCRDREEIFLVYEFMANGSLDSHLFKEDNCLKWEVRYKIVLDLASGLLYLHEEWDKNRFVVHRNVKPSNIMLDSDFNAKLGDFYLAKFMEPGTEPETTDLVGTVGYIDPEYIVRRKVRRESDVYSFGIVALEIACGRKSLDHKVIDDQLFDIVEWVWDLYGKGKILEAADPRLRGYFNRQQMERLLVIGLWCACPKARFRPTIKQAIRILKFEAELPALPPKVTLPCFA